MWGSAPFEKRGFPELGRHSGRETPNAGSNTIRFRFKVIKGPDSQLWTQLWKPRLLEGAATLGACRPRSISGLLEGQGAGKKDKTLKNLVEVTQLGRDGQGMKEGFLQLQVAGPVGRKTCSEWALNARRKELF